MILTETNEIVAETKKFTVKQSPVCVLCEFVINEVDKKILKNSTKVNIDWECDKIFKLKIEKSFDVN